MKTAKLLSAAVVVVLGLGLGAALLLKRSPRADTPEGLREFAMQKLGEQLATSRPSCRVLLLSNPFLQRAGLLDPRLSFERAALRGLRRGLGARCSVAVAFPELRPEYAANPQAAPIPADSRTPLSFLVRPESVESLTKAHSDCTVVVSLIGLPAGIDQTKLWQDAAAPSFALLQPDLRVLGRPEQTIDAFDRGKLLAAVSENDPTPGQALVVTRENIRQILNQHPSVLGF